jgi:hypothetical protein
MSLIDNWKNAELRIAKMFGVFRNPNSSKWSRHNTSSDTLHQKLYIETKYSKNFPQQKLWLDTLSKSKAEDKIPIIVFVKRGNSSPIVVCELKKLKQIAAEIQDDDTKEEN